MASSSSEFPFPSNYDDDREMTDEEMALYYDAVSKSEGFDVPHFPESYALGRIEPVAQSRLNQKWILIGAAEAIKDYNIKNETNFEVLEIEKATIQAARGRYFYITFKVKPNGTPADHPTTTFQAKVLYGLDGLEIEICRIKPTN